MSKIAQNDVFWFYFAILKIKTHFVLLRSVESRNLRSVLGVDQCMFQSRLTQMKFKMIILAPKIAKNHGFYVLSANFGQLY